MYLYFVSGKTKSNLEVSRLLLFHIYHYRPQTKFAKVRLCFYTCLSVILFTGGVPGQVTPKVHPRQVHPPGQVHPPAGTPPATVHAGIRSTIGRYASHWNAFLFCGSFCNKTIHFSSYSNGLNFNQINTGSFFWRIPIR